MPCRPALSLPPALTGGQPCRLPAPLPFCTPSSCKWQPVGLGRAVRTALRGAGGPGAAGWDVWHGGATLLLRMSDFGVNLIILCTTHPAPVVLRGKQAAYQGHGASCLADFHARMAALSTWGIGDIHQTRLRGRFPNTTFS